MRGATARFDEVIHAPHRLRICAMLNGARMVEFSVLRQHLGLSKSALSKHLSQLVDAGYVEQSRATRDSRSHVWLTLTREGQKAYAGHRESLRQIMTGG